MPLDPATMKWAHPYLNTLRAISVDFPKLATLGKICDAYEQGAMPEADFLQFFEDFYKKLNEICDQHKVKRIVEI